jgi:hypothetical protein
LDFVTTVDQSDIRGLVTGMSSIRQGLPLLYKLASADSFDRPYRVARGFPPTVQPTRPLPWDLSRYFFNQSPSKIFAHAETASSASSRPIAQMKPASSRATAVTASAGCFPRPINFLSRL